MTHVACWVTVRKSKSWTSFLCPPTFYIDKGTAETSTTPSSHHQLLPFLFYFIFFSENWKGNKKRITSSSQSQKSKANVALGHLLSPCTAQQASTTNGKSTMLWESGIKEREMDSWRRWNLDQLHSSQWRRLMEITPQECRYKHIL